MTRDIVEVCEDCLCVAANGRDDGATYEADHEAHYAAATEDHGGEPVAVIDDAGEVPQGFGKNPCGFCGSTLWGSRYEAVIV